MSPGGAGSPGGVHGRGGEMLKDMEKKRWWSPHRKPITRCYRLFSTDCRYTNSRRPRHLKDTTRGGLGLVIELLVLLLGELLGWNKPKHNKKKGVLE